MEKEKIILIGSGQHANVVLYNIEEQGKYEVVGILDRDRIRTGRLYRNIKIIGSYEDDLAVIENKYKTNKFFIGFGNMKHRKSVFEKMIKAGWEAVNIIHPKAIVSKEAKLGKGILIECGCLITPNPTLGSNVVINTGSQVNHDNILEDHVYIASGVVLSGGVTIKENSLIDDGVIISLGKIIGRNSIIGAGAVVTRNIGDNIVAYGNPAKEIRKNEM